MKELVGIEQYLSSEQSEAAKRPLVYPLFMALFKDKFLVESAAAGADGYVEGQLLRNSKPAPTIG